MRNRFEELCKKYGADKLKVGYEDVYESAFGNIRTDIKKMLEIGLTHGHSMKMWMKYFPNAEITGIEYAIGGEFECLNHLPENMTNNIFNGDQSDRDDLSEFIKKYGRNFNIIVDDGGHCMNEQQISLGYLFPYVESGGYYVVEDLHTSLAPFPNRWNIGLVKQESGWWDKNPKPVERKWNSLREFTNDGVGFPKNGTPLKTTLEILQNYNKNGKMESDYMIDTEIEYLNNYIDSIDIYYTGHCNREWGNKHVIAFIKKK
tara:strand:+ start:58 stop:837 length:780 start_codon:yes stop_codon:yes gene_type:complete